jgi:hypothetical protein
MMWWVYDLELVGYGVMLLQSGGMIPWVFFRSEFHERRITGVLVAFPGFTDFFYDGYGMINGFYVLVWLLRFFA